MKVYTVQRMDKIDYDFSVEVTNHGCYADKEDALHKANRAYKQLCAEYEEEMKRYADESVYRDIDEGLLDIEEDEENGYYRISFGFEEDYECHSIGVDEWTVQE